MRIGFRVGMMATMVVILFMVAIGGIYATRSEFSPDEARQRIREGNYDVIVDGRTPEEWATGHRSDAISIPIGEFVTEFPKKVPLCLPKGNTSAGSGSHGSEEGIYSR